MPADGKLSSANWEYSQGVHEATCGQVEGASLHQNPSKRQSGTINSLPLWHLGSTGQHFCSDYPLWASQTLQVHEGSSKRSISWFWDFHSLDSSYARGRRWQAVSSILKKFPIHYILFRGYANQEKKRQTPVLNRVHQTIWSEPYSSWYMIHVEHYAPQGYATLGNSHPSIEGYTDYLPYMVSMSMVRVRWVRSNSDVRSIIWSLK